MKKENFYILVIVILVLLNIGVLGTVWFGRRDHVPPPRHGEHGRDFVDDELKFSNEQSKQHTQLREAYQQKNKDLQDQRRKLYEGYFSLLKEDTIDLRQADSVNSLIAANQKLINENTFQHFMAMKKLCTPEQVDDYNDFIIEFGRMLSSPPPPRGQHGPPPPPPNH